MKTFRFRRKRFVSGQNVNLNENSQHNKIKVAVASKLQQPPQYDSFKEVYYF
jgi:hypothetical protein